LLNTFIAELGWEALLNTRGTTWRKLDETVRAGINNADAAGLMLEMPAIIKRPLLCAPGQPMLLGFSELTYKKLVNEV
jgi:arsenate reductase-like glutaredoxin family protein